MLLLYYNLGYCFLGEQNKLLFWLTAVTGMLRHYLTLIRSADAWLGRS